MYSDFISLVREIYNVPEEFIALHEPRFVGNEKKYLIDAIDSTYVSSVGEYVNRFEKMLSEMTGAKYAIATSNGTAALHVALKLSGVEQDTEVITQAISFVATANSISYEKAIPHFVDVDEDTLGLSPSALAKRLENIATIKDGQTYNRETGRRISACVPMHTFGIPCRITEIIEICKKYNIPVVEDASESIGSYYHGIHTGIFGKFGTFSFNGNKTITSGGGGAIVTNDEAIAKRTKHITTTAKVPHQWEYFHDEIGYNYRMPNLNAALLCAQLEKLNDFLENKRRVFKTYEEFFDKKKGIKLIKEPEGSVSNFWLNAIQLSDLKERNAFLKYTNENGIMTRPIWTLLNTLPMFVSCPCGPLQVSETLANTIVNIPSSVVI